MPTFKVLCIFCANASTIWCENQETLDIFAQQYVCGACDDAGYGRLTPREIEELKSLLRKNQNTEQEKNQ